MHWILAAILILRSLIPIGLGAAFGLPVNSLNACSAPASLAAIDTAGCICCDIGSCACEMAPAPALPSPMPEPVSPGGTSSVRPILLSIEPPTTMVVGWINEPARAFEPAALGPVHATLGLSIQAALCIWRT